MKGANQSSACAAFGTAIPVQGWTGPESSRSLRLSIIKTIDTWSW